MAAIALSRTRLVSGRFIAFMVALAAFALGLGGGYALSNHPAVAAGVHAAPVLVVDGPQSDLTRALPSQAPAGGPDSDLTRALPR